MILSSEVIVDYRTYDLKMSSVPLTEKNLKKYDCLVISTDHSSHDYNFIAKNSRLVVDTRNAMKGGAWVCRGEDYKSVKRKIRERLTKTIEF